MRRGNTPSCLGFSTLSFNFQNSREDGFVDIISCAYGPKQQNLHLFKEGISPSLCFIRKNGLETDSLFFGLKELTMRMRLFYFFKMSETNLCCFAFEGKESHSGGFLTKRVKMQIFKGDIFDRSCRPCSTEHHHMMPSCLSIAPIHPSHNNTQKQLFNNMLNC